ncbi:MAG: lipopolysaccharide assembly protein LapB [Halieaceae bacterium]|nr:lipopolysaccharide assembly protein LapB [Halieaceae bacterium]
MSDLVVFGFLFAATGIGWVLGRRSSLQASALSEYFSGRRGARRVEDPVLDSIVDGLAADKGSARTRIALGVQLRRRGEVDGAVRVHQDVIARPSLAADDAVRARLELALDYISAGLLDRAEELLLELVQDYPEQSRAGRMHLLEIYEIERDWRRAIDVAKALLPRKLQRDRPAPDGIPERGQRPALRLAHYCCELAEEARFSGDPAAARQLLQDALGHDKQCVRASMLLSQLAYDAGRYREAAQALQRVRLQDPDYLPETIDLLRQCHDELGEQQALRAYLLECLALRPTPGLVAAIARDMARADGPAAASRFLSEQLLKYPSLGGMAQLIGLQMEASEGKAREDFGMLQNLAHSLVASRPSYRCGHCGFAGKHLHWSCPGCKHWGSIKAIDGAAAG